MFLKLSFIRRKRKQAGTSSSARARRRAAMAALAAEEAAKAQAAQLASANSNSLMNNGMLQHISRGNFFEFFTRAGSVDRIQRTK